MKNQALSPQKRLGLWGENEVMKLYQKRGYWVVLQGYQCRWGEIDLILQEKLSVKERLQLRLFDKKPERSYVFCEVKLRRSRDFAAAREQVTRQKQRRIARTALTFLQSHDIGWANMRFDVAEVYAPDGIGGRTEIEIIEGAFEAPI